MLSSFSIAIPTYNRPKQLRRTVESLKRLNSTCVPIVIIDNSSDIPVTESLFDLLDDDNIVVMRNRANVGSVANILRCVETAKTEFVWVLGDDDIVEDTAIQTIREEILSFPRACFINFASVWSGARSENRVATGLHSYLQAIESIPGQMFISSSVFHVPTFLKYIRFGYLGVYSSIGFLFPVIMALDAGGTAVLSEKKIVSYDTDPANGWDAFPVAKGIMTILELPCAWEKSTFDRLAAFLPVGIVPNGRMLLWQYFNNALKMPTFQRRYVFRQLIERTSPWTDETPRTCFKKLLLHILVRLPDKVTEFLARNRPAVESEPHFDRYRRL